MKHRNNKRNKQTTKVTKKKKETTKVTKKQKNIERQKEK